MTAKILWNTTLSVPQAKYSTLNVGNFCLATPLGRFEYMRIRADLVPKAFKTKYKLHNKFHREHVHMEIRRGCYGLPQADILANKLLKKE